MRHVRGASPSTETAEEHRLAEWDYLLRQLRVAVGDGDPDEYAVDYIAAYEAAYAKAVSGGSSVESGYRYVGHLAARAATNTTGR